MTMLGCSAFNRTLSLCQDLHQCEHASYDEKRAERHHPDLCVVDASIPRYLLADSGKDGVQPHHQSDSHASGCGQESEGCDIRCGRGREQCGYSDCDHSSDDYRCRCERERLYAAAVESARLQRMIAVDCMNSICHVGMVATELCHYKNRDTESV